MSMDGSTDMLGLLDHLIILPIVVPLVAGATLLLIDERRRAAKIAISLSATLALIAIAIALVLRADAVALEGTGLTATYPLGNWPMPFGIVLVADRLSALMLLITAIMGLCAQSYAIARWNQAGPNIYTLFQLLLMGLNGAFLTGDLFNLFVFFEVLLAASYGLVLHGTGPVRVKAGLHYIAINLVASFLFLIGVSLIYGITGTLNMADLAQRIPAIAAEDRTLFQAGAAVLGIAFLVKAGMWPLSFWLPITYSAASAPVAGMFAVLTKVGVYIVMRLSPLLFGPDAGASFGFGQSVLLYGGLATIAYGSFGVLASQSTARLAGNCVLISSGTLLAAVGMGNEAVTSGALYYLVSSSLALAALFLLVELVERARVAGADVLAVTMEAYGGDEDDLQTPEEEVGVVIPGAVAILALSFAACAILLSGLPPLSGFLAKFAMMSAMLNLNGLGASNWIPVTSWMLVALLILSGLAALVAMLRAGISIFWVTLEDAAASVRLIEIAPVILLLSLCIGMTVLAGPVTRYMEDTAESLHVPARYIVDVMHAPLVVATGTEIHP
jgi:multicomponent K+:H+ antiporter subunit D